MSDVKGGSANDRPVPWWRGWRLGYVIAVGAFAAILINIGSQMLASPCGGELCLGWVGLFIVVGAVVLFGCGLLFALGISAGPMYVLGCFGAMGAIDPVLMNDAGPEVGVAIAGLAASCLAIVSLVDLRRQTVNTFAAAVSMIGLAVFILTGGPEWIFLRLLVAGLGVVPIVAWAITRRMDRIDEPFAQRA